MICPIAAFTTACAVASAASAAMLRWFLLRERRRHSSTLTALVDANRIIDKLDRALAAAAAKQKAAE